jgi:hypothetical protein
VSPPSRHHSPQAGSFFKKGAGEQQQFLEQQLEKEMESSVVYWDGGRRDAPADPTASQTPTAPARLVWCHPVSVTVIFDRVLPASCLKSRVQTFQA